MNTVLTVLAKAAPEEFLIDKLTTDIDRLNEAKKLNKDDKEVEEIKNSLAATCTMFAVKQSTKDDDIGKTLDIMEEIENNIKTGEKINKGTN